MDRSLLRGVVFPRAIPRDGWQRGRERIGIERVCCSHCTERGVTAPIDRILFAGKILVACWDPNPTPIPPSLQNPLVSPGSAPHVVRGFPRTVCSAPLHPSRPPSSLHQP